MTMTFSVGHTEIKIIYNKLDYISEIHNPQYSLLLVPLSLWIKYVDFLMYCRHHILVIL